MTLPRAGLLAKPSNWWRRALVRLVTKNLIILHLHDHMEIGETYRRTIITAKLHLSGLYDSILSWVKTHENSLGICKKKHLKNPQTTSGKIFWSDKPQYQASCLKETSSAHHLQSTIPKVKCAGNCFSVTGTRQSRKKAQCTKILRWH